MSRSPSSPPRATALYIDSSQLVGDPAHPASPMSRSQSAASAMPMYVRIMEGPSNPNVGVTSPGKLGPNFFATAPPPSTPWVVDQQIFMESPTTVAVPQARRGVRFLCLLVTIVSGFFTQYQPVSLCAFTFHAGFLSFLYLEKYWLRRWFGTLLIAVAMGMSMAQLFRSDDAGTEPWSWESMGISVGIMVIVAHLFMFAGCMHCGLAARPSRSLWALGCYPSMVASLYAIASLFTPLGSQASLAYVVADWLSLVQVVSLLGITGLNFVILIISTGIAHSLVIDRGVGGTGRSSSNKRQRKSTAIAAAVVCVAWMYGSVRMLVPYMYQKPVADTPKPTASDWTRAACIVQDFDNEIDMMQTTRDTLRENADIHFVVWSETAAGVFYDDRDIGSLLSWQVPRLSPYLAAAQALAVQYHTTLAITYGVWTNPDDPTDDKRYNMFTFIDSDGSILFEYSKHYPVPVIENYVTASKEPMPSATSRDLGSFNAAICFDFDHPEFIRKSATTGLLIQTANTWGIVGKIHGASSAFRAIENGMYLVRCGSHGSSGVYDTYGNVYSYASRSGSDVLFMDVPINTKQMWTVYTHGGYVIDYILFAIAFGYLVAYFYKRGSPRNDNEFQG